MAETLSEPVSAFHKWAINEDPNAPSVHRTSTGRPDHCLTCGIVRYPLVEWAQKLAEAPCPGVPYSRTRRS